MKYLIIIVITCLCITITDAQSIKDKQIEVMKEFTTNIYDANPIASNINIVLPSRTNNYQVTDSLVSLQKYSPSLELSVQPISYNYNNDETLHSGYVVVNKGTINQWNGELGYTHRVDNYFTVDARVLYDEWEDKSIIDQYTRTMMANIGLKYYLTDKWFTSISLSGGRQLYGAYGYNNELTQESVDTIGVKTFDMAFAVQSFNSGDHDFNVSFEADLDMTSIAEQDAMENLWTLSPSIIKNFGNEWAINNSTQYITTSNRSIENNNALSNILTVKYKPSNWSLYTGASYNRVSSQNRFFPYIQARINIDKKSTMAIEAKETLSYIGLGAHMDVNPYIDINTVNPNITINQSGGIAYNTRIADDYTIQIKTTYTNTIDGINYIGEASKKEFSIENVDFKQLTFNTKFEYFYTDFLSGGINIDYNRYESVETLYHRPDGIITPFIKASTPDDKLKAELSGFLTTKQNLYSNIDGTVVQSNIRKDLSLQLSYSPISRLNIYFNADNILNDDFEALSGYSVYGRNLSGGLLFKF